MIQIARNLSQTPKNTPAEAGAVLSFLAVAGRGGLGRLAILYPALVP
jgi:hypothetical protein